MKYVKFTIISPYNLQNLLIFLISLESPWWSPFFGQNFLIWWPKTSGLPLLQRIFLYTMALSHHVLRRKKVEFVTFQPNHLGCPQNIIAGFQNYVYCTLCLENLAKFLVKDPPSTFLTIFLQKYLLSTNTV